MGFTNIIDRRKTNKNKSVVNRQRFLKRARVVIKKQVDKIVSSKSLTDIGKGDKITISRKTIKEPVFSHGKGGRKDYILPGNQDKIVGDMIPKPEGAGGSGRGIEGSPKGKGEDDFSFELSSDEFLDFFFDDLELPDLIKTRLKDTTVYKLARAGFTSVGIPANLNILRSMKQSLARKIALQAPFLKRIKEIEKELEEDKENALLLLELEVMKKKRDAVPFIDEIDLRYNAFEKRPQPSTKAVMFCIMDVSGSMGKYEKDLAKRFFTLLYLFLTRKYEKVDIIFIRHTTEANEVDENEFFHGRQTGGTIVSSALILTSDIIKERYPTSDWNIYISQASDSDNWGEDSPKCLKVLENDILPFTQYYAYVEISHEPDSGWFTSGNLWKHYKLLKNAYNNFVMKKIASAEDIYPVFRSLFEKDRLKNG